MKHLAILSCLAVACILLAGCAAPYKQLGSTGGFDQRQLTRNQFDVGFSGNQYTSGQRAVDLCLLRCAELTLGHGFRYFVITRNKVSYNNSTTVAVEKMIPTGAGNGFIMASSQTIPQPKAIERILCFREVPQEYSDANYDAQTVYDQLSAKYRIHKAVQQFPPYRLPIATIGLERDNLKVYHPQLTENCPPLAIAGKHQAFQVQSLQDGNPAKDAGIQIGDQILAFDGTAVTNLAEIEDAESTWRIGQSVQVKVWRSGNKLTIPVKACFNPIMRFKKEHEIAISGSQTEDDISVIEDSYPKVTIFFTSVYDDWERPVESDLELKHYLIEAAIHNGANGVIILNSQEKIKEVRPNTDERVGFMCMLGIIPKAQLGVEYETGQTYEDRRVIRRITTTFANDAGLEIGDNILAINGIDPVHQRDDYEKDQMNWEIGQKIPVTVARNGKEINLTVKLAANHL